MSLGPPPQHGYLPNTTSSTGDCAPAVSGHFALDHGILANAPSVPGAPPPSNRKKQRPSKTKPGKQLSKSLSTPQLRGPIMSDPDFDKKRNKLGYQRISIACAHCRRRKIRCLVSEDESEPRCQNCIRLKKECVFYPVDQQAALDARSEASNQSAAPSAPSAPSSAVSTSPAQLDPRTFEPVHQLDGGYQHASTDGPSGFQGIQIPAGGSMPLPGNYSPQGYPYSARSETTSQTWGQDYGTHSQQRTMASTSHQRYNPAIGADVSPFPSSGHPSPNVSQVEGFAYTPEQVQQTWQIQQQQPARSMSFPDPNRAYGSPFPNQPAQGSYMQHPSMHGQAHDPHLIPMSAPQMHPPGPQQYFFHPDQRSSSVPGMNPYQQPAQQIHSSWYPNAPPFPPTYNASHPHHDHSQQGGYNGGSG